jgi:glucose/arabinose dehydrogenase
MTTRIAAAVTLAATFSVAIAVLALSPWPGGSSAGEILQGDADCNEAIDARDGLAALRFAADAEPFANCVEEAGDVDCDGGVDLDDVLLILLYSGGISSGAPAGFCPAIGDPIDTTPPPTVTATATLTASPSATATPAPTATSAGTPAANGYHLETVLSSAYLAGANGSVIELALIPGEPDAAIAALQSGQMYRVSLSGSFAPALWGNVSGILDTAHNEEGLLSLAFPPDFQASGRVYLYYTVDDPDRSILARYTATGNDLDEDSAEELIPFAQPAGNHNGGHIVFGHDGLLLLSLGDGGSTPDNAQELTTLLGKVIRIDVSPANGYDIPPGNPFGDEIFALGFRNPWRMTIDSLTGDAWLGDVGQGEWEEVDHVTLGGNYGWDCREGPDPYEVDGQCTGKQFAEPRAYYSHSFGQAVTGGFVYRGSAMPELYGWYVYGDFYSGRIWAVNTAGGGDPILLTDEDVNVASFTELPDGELLIISYSNGILRLARD